MFETSMHFLKRRKDTIAIPLDNLNLIWDYKVEDEKIRELIAILEICEKNKYNVFDKIYEEILSPVYIDDRFDFFKGDIKNFKNLPISDKYKIICDILESFKNKRIDIANLIFNILVNFSIEFSKKYNLASSDLIDNLSRFTRLSCKKIIFYRFSKIFGDKFDQQNIGKLISEEDYRISKIQFIRKEMKKLRSFSIRLSVTLEKSDFETDNGEKISPLFTAFNEVFLSSSLTDFSSLSGQIYCDLEYEDQLLFYLYLKIGGASDSYLAKIFNPEVIKNANERGFNGIELIDYSDTYIKENGLLPPDAFESNDGIVEIDEVFRDGFISFNPHLIELTLGVGLQLFGELKFRNLYKKYFYKIYTNLVERIKGKKERFYNIFAFSDKDLPRETKNRLGEKKDSLQYFQHVVEWDLDKEFTDKDLLNLGKILRTIISDFNVNPTQESVYNFGAIRTMPGEIYYKGLFVANQKFRTTNLLLLEDKSTGKRRIRLALDGLEVGQDEFIYLMTQISYYLNNKKFIETKQLYSNIYDEYNRIRMRNQNIFDISVFAEQYEQLIEGIIRPLSREYFKRHGKAGNPMDTMLLGVYGTGKSQFLFNLLTRRCFEFNGRKLHFNANVLSMNVIEFMQVLGNETSKFRKRLSDIYENTGLPIVLIIEDIETLINEDNGNSDLITESMTNFFDGVGSIPVTIVTTTNFPERFSGRLLRPNRVENIINFPLPLNIDLRRNIFNVHIEINCLKDILPKDFILKYLSRTEWFTTSHIASFISRIKSFFDFKKEFNPDYELTEKDIEKIFNEIPLGAEDIISRQLSISEWLRLLKDKGGKLPVGFSL